jgi:restriction endonuclease S subunit
VVSSVPPGWDLVSLNELQADEPRAITDGPFGSNLTSAHYTEQGPRVVRLQNIGDGRFVDAHAYISQQHFESLRAHEVLAGDLLVASLGDDPPRACLAPPALGPAIVKADCIRVRLAPSVDPRWVMYAMQTPAVRTWASEKMYGVGRPRLGLKTIRAIPIPVPPLSEQRRIVEILEDHLSRLDAAEAGLTSAQRRLKALHKSVLLKVIPDVANYPAAWRTSTVEQAGKVGLGRQRHPDWHTGPNMKPYLRVANVFEDRIETRSVYEMHWPGNTFDQFRLTPGDVLLNEGQTPELLGRPALYRGQPSDVAFTNSLLRFQSSEEVLPEFALLVFRRHMHAGRFTRESRITTNIAHLSAARLKPIEFPIPPMRVQHELVSQADTQLSALTHLGVETAATRVRSTGLRRALLSAAFSGQLT